MNWLYKKRLKQLLLDSAQHEQEELIQASCQALVAHHSVYYVTSRVLTKNLLEIYERRSKYKDLPAKGFQIILPALKATNDTYTRIHGFACDRFDYTIFTNVATTTLLGILAVKEDRRKIGQMRGPDRTGYERDRLTHGPPSTTSE